MSGLRLVPASSLFCDVVDRYPGGAFDESVSQECGLHWQQGEHAPSKSAVPESEGDVAIYIPSELHRGLMLDVDIAVLRELVRNRRVQLCSDKTQATNDLFELLRGAGLTVQQDGILIDSQVHGGAFQ